MLATSFLVPISAHAQDASWLAAPATSNWNSNANWTPATVPTGTATFGPSTQTSLTFTAANTNIGTMQFNAGAPAYTFTLTSDHVLNVNGAGIVNNSSNKPTFSVDASNLVLVTNFLLNFNNAASAGNAAINVSNSAWVQFFNTSTAANATFTLTTAGTLIFNDSSNAGTSTINDTAGALNFTGSSSAGSSTITTGTDLAAFIQSSTAANAHITIPTGSVGVNFSGSSSGGNAVIDNASAGVLSLGGVSFIGASSAASSTITNSSGGKLTFGSATLGLGFDFTKGTGSAGNATINNNNGGSTIFFNQSTAGTATITNSAGGSLLFVNAGGLPADPDAANARVINNAGGTVDISGVNTGVSIGSLAGAGQVLLGAKTLTLGNTNLNSEVSGAITGFGNLIKEGSGILTLSGNNHYSGFTAVNAGTLLVNGTISFSSGLTVNAGGTVGGSGNLPKTTINGGSLSPGNSIGTISIAGGLTFVGAGNYIVEVSPAAADKTNVTGAPGTAILAGTLSAVGTGGSYTAGTKYTVLNAIGGVSGTFGNLAISGSFGATKPHIEYDANNVYLVLDQNALPLTGLTPNERSVATAINTALMAGNQSAPFVALFGLTAAQLPGALDQLSGEVHPSTASVLLDESLYARSAVLGRLRQASYGGDAQMASLSSGGPTAYANGEQLSALAYAKSPIVTKAPPMVSQPGYDVVFWAQGFGATGRFDTDGNAAAVRRDLAGFFSGVDTRVGTNGRLGIAAGYTGSRNALDGRGSSTVETGHIAGYGGWSYGNLNLRGGGDFAFHTIDTGRTVFFPGFFDTDTAHYNGTTGQVFGELGYGFAFGKVAVEPFAGAAWVRLHADGFNERGGAAALTVAANSFEVGYSTFGIRAASMIPLANDMMLVPRGSLAWQHAFDTVTPADTLAFQSAGVPFVIAGVPIARDALLAEAGLDLAIGRNTTVGVSYVGQIANNVRDHAAKGKFTWKF